MSDILDLLDEIKNLELSSSRKAVPLNLNKRLIKALKVTDLAFFQPIADLGYFGWEMKGPYKELEKVTVEDINELLHDDAKPSAVASVQELNKKLPKPFANDLPPQEFVNKYPYRIPLIVPVHVAIQYRGMDLSEIDFYFGGSTLEMLATQNTNEKAYVVALLPGTEIIVISKHDEYTANKSDMGFQFERFTLGNKFDDKHNMQCVCHMQIMDVGEYRVFFNAEADGIDGNDDPVEVTCSNPRYWGTGKVYQMLSSGSLTLYQGSKDRKTLNHVADVSFEKIVRDSFVGTTRERHERRIKDAMSFLMKERNHGRFHGDKTFQIRFDRTQSLILDPCKAENLFVSSRVIKTLIA